MKTTSLLLLVFVFSASINAQYNTKNLTLASNENATKFTYGNMRVYPVYANDAFELINKNSDNFITLKDALDKKKIKISENNSNNESAEVNILSIQNLSDDSIMILGGEIIEGGKQDRMIADDVIIAPHTSKTRLKVYCVEHGRWTTKGNNAELFNFSPSKGTPMASPTIRKAGSVQKNQSMVWEQVEDVTDRSKVKIDYSEIRNYMNNLLSDEKSQEQKIKSNGTLLKNNANKLHIATY